MNSEIVWKDGVGGVRFPEGIVWADNRYVREKQRRVALEELVKADDIDAVFEETFGGSECGQ